MPSLVEPEFRPTLADLLRPLPRAARLTVWIVLGLVAVVGAYLVLVGPPSGDVRVVVRGERTFNVAHGPRLERVSQPGALLALDRRDDGRLIDSFTVRPLELAPYRGFSSGVLPLLGGRRLAEQRDRLPGFSTPPSPEGRARINEVPGYQVTYRYQDGDRTIYARDLYLVPDVPGERRGVLLELRSTQASGTPNAASVGRVGVLKLPLRSFRFGTEAEGGAA